MVTNFAVVGAPASADTACLAYASNAVCADVTLVQATTDMHNNQLVPVMFAQCFLCRPIHHSS